MFPLQFGLEAVFSKERLEPYYAYRSECFDAVISRYFWNVRLCESLYPTLHYLEISLRNKIHHEAVVHFSRDDWFCGLFNLGTSEYKCIKKALNTLRRRSKCTTASGAIIAELSFVFWVNLFNKNYDVLLYRPVLSKVFSDAPKSRRTRDSIRAMLDRIRILRNRVFHHEPIWNQQDIFQTRNDILEIIAWLDTALFWLIKKEDRFEFVYRDGAANIF